MLSHVCLSPFAVYHAGGTGLVTLAPALLVRITSKAYRSQRRSGGDTCKQPVVVRNMVNAHTL